ncbi:MAG: hypothetical protein QOC90_980, partial [Mycobacterium sp.]|nr:hypothetical protein [Mycobacterium sp.]
GSGVDAVGIDPHRGETRRGRRRDQIGSRKIPAAIGGQGKLHSRSTLLGIEVRSPVEVAAVVDRSDAVVPIVRPRRRIGRVDSAGARNGALGTRRCPGRTPSAPTGATRE